MNKIEINKLNEYIYHETLDNGLNVYLYPTTKTNEYEVSFFTKFGSIYNSFKYEGDIEFKEYPNGIAHFLEHKLFESEKGSSMEYFSKTGTYSNAYTSYFTTNYIINGKEEYTNNLNYLIDFVQKPYFTYENVEKEKGIIEQELNMYMDDPYNKMHEVNRFNLVTKHPIRFDVGGTVLDIKQITKEMLDDCYYTFYSPNNMSIVISGNIDIDETINIIKNNQSKKELINKKYILKEYIENKEILKKQEILNMEVNIPLVSFGIKLIHPFKIDKLKMEYYLSSIIYQNFNKISDFYLDKLKEHKVLAPLGLMFYVLDDFSLVFIMSETNMPNELIEDISNKLKKLIITEEFFERLKKKEISNIIYTFESHKDINDYILNSIIDHGYPIDNIIDIINDLKFKELEEIFNALQFDITSSVIIEKDRH